MLISKNKQKPGATQKRENVCDVVAKEYVKHNFTYFKEIVDGAFDV